MRSMPLTQRAWAIAAKIFLLILPHMAVIPSDPNGPFSFGMVNFRGEASIHGIGVNWVRDEPDSD